MRNELAKVEAFYAAHEEHLALSLNDALANNSQNSDPASIEALRCQLQELRKYVMLNYVAVVKAVKKRNRHLSSACGHTSPSIRAVNILAGEHFFTSLRLAALATRAEIAAREVARATSNSAAPFTATFEEEYQCPICLELLRSPVVLSCAHRACWGCLVAYCSAVRNAQLESQMADGHRDEEPSKARQIDFQTDQGSRPPSPTTVVKPAVWEGEASDDESVTVATFCCPCCRQDQLLDLDRLSVDPHLDAYVKKLSAEREASERGHAKPVLAAISSAPIAINAMAVAAISVPEPMDIDPTPKAVLAIAAEAQPAPFPATVQQPHAVVAHEPNVKPDEPLLPPVSKEYTSRLVVCLDLDGTLVTTFTPKRAPSLPPSAVSYIVGKGGRLNPGGVFVVERPGLGAFLRRIRTFSEVVLFTAGLEDYAAPICDEIERRYGPFCHRLYRPATVHSDVYPCIKDLSRLGRDLGRCVLVDDTPLAFFRQPDHGVPVLQFRGDPDDRILTEAVAPLLESLANVVDVSQPLARRFNMRRWFHAQGLQTGPIGSKAAAMVRAPSAPALPLTSNSAKRPPASGAVTLPGQGALHNAPAAQILMASSPASQVLLVCDFDKTLIEYDAGERICDDLAPELTSLLSQIETPANFVPVTNAVLAEMQRRGISRDRLVGTLRSMGGEVPGGTTRMLRWAARQGVDVRILSDANSVFISHMLTAAKLASCVRDIVTNTATFQRIEATTEVSIVADSNHSYSSSAEDPESAGSSGLSRWLFGRRPPTPPPNGHSEMANKEARSGGVGTPQLVAPQYRLVIAPRHDHHNLGPHGCPLCPVNLCKGRELDAMRAAAPRRKVVYAGDGANDLCPALCLGPDDVVLARSGHPLELLIAERAKGGGGDRRRVVAQVRIWRTHDELARLVQEVAV